MPRALERGFTIGPAASLMVARLERRHEWWARRPGETCGLAGSSAPPPGPLRAAEQSGNPTSYELGCAPPRARRTHTRVVGRRLYCAPLRHERDRSVRSKSCRSTPRSSWSVLQAPSARRDRSRRCTRRKSSWCAKVNAVLLSTAIRRRTHDPGYTGLSARRPREWRSYTHLRLARVGPRAAGDGVRAERIFRLLNPVLRTRAEADVDRYRVEPYRWPPNLQRRRARRPRSWTWYTARRPGPALGVKRSSPLSRSRGYRFDPCIPPEWPRFEATLRLGPSQLHVEVTNPDGVARGVIELSVDGKAQDPSRVVELSPKRSVHHHVRVVLGNDGSQPRAHNRERTVKAIGDRHTVRRDWLTGFQTLDPVSALWAQDVHATQAASMDPSVKAPPAQCALPQISSLPASCARLARHPDGALRPWG